jgi:sugar-specific transcriptional regulator TrmB
MNFLLLKNTGLSDKEIKIYLKLLEFGDMSVRDLAQATNLNRGTTYDILKVLQEKGLVSYFHKETKQKFVAEPPEKILKLLDDQEDRLIKSKAEVEKIIPELKSIQDKGGNLPVTKYYEDKKGLKTILEDLLMTMAKSSVKEYYAYSAKEASDDINEAYPGFTKDRIKHGISVKAISLAKGGKVSGLDERRWLGTDNETATFILIYNNKCAFISRDAKSMPVGVLIENQMIFETQREIFLRLWELLT